MRRQTQNQKVLSYMQRYGSITSLEAIQNFGCTRLSARIYDLRKEKYNIKSELVRVKTRDGETTVSAYRLEDSDGTIQDNRS